jgi:tRNA pseudouridine 55 synthase
MDGILLVNKPKGISSHDVVFKVKKALNTKKVGHCGTLDPNASGVLVLGINKGTKLLQFLVSDQKKYLATLVLGESRDTYDSEGTIISQKPYLNDLNEIMVLDVLKQFLGKQKQKPPIYSAIKVKGKKLYEYARNNEEVEIKERVIEIFDLSLISLIDNQVIINTHCSKGTYIRSLVVDIAEKLDYPGYLSELVRTQSGSFKLEDCYSLEDIENQKFKLINMSKALSFMPHLIIEDENIVYHGKYINSNINQQVAIYNQENKLLAVYEPTGTGKLKSVRGLW